MAGTPKLVVSRQGVDNRTGSLLNMSLDTSRSKIQKIVKCIKSTTGVDMPHGLAYSPRFIGVRKFASPNRVCMIGVNEEFFVRGKSDPYYLNIEANGDETAIYAHVILDPIGTPEGTEPHFRTDLPRLMIGEDLTTPDHEKLLDSYYDTFKIFKTGNLSIHVDEITHAIGDTGTTTEEDAFGNTYIVEETVVTYDHNLGYFPLFAPFVNGSIDYTLYKGWNDQWYSGGGDSIWEADQEIVINQYRIGAEDGKTYTCIKSHTTSATNKPVSGAEWETYWTMSRDNEDVWVTGTNYVIGNKVIVFMEYEGWRSWDIAVCISNHTASATSKPYTGATWDTYWTYETEYPPAPLTISLNDLEDVKVVYGGVEAFNLIYLEYYATETQLVLKLIRKTYDWGGDPNEAQPEIDLSVDFTIFYNRADEEFDLLS